MTDDREAFKYPPEFIAKVKNEFPEKVWIGPSLHAGDHQKIGHFLSDTCSIDVTLTAEEIMDFFDTEGNPLPEPLLPIIATLSPLP